jgi:hypothetical protein
MIAARFPELGPLSATERLQLADELYSQVFAGSPSLTDGEIYVELQKSFEHAKAHPETTSTWDEVKARVLASRRA